MITRPEKLITETIKVKTGCGSMFVTITPKESEYKEVFAMLGKTGGCPACNVSSLTRTITVAINHGVPLDKLTKQLTGVRCPNDSEFLPSCPEAIARVIKSVWGGQ